MYYITLQTTTAVFILLFVVACGGSKQAHGFSPVLLRCLTSWKPRLQPDHTVSTGQRELCTKVYVCFQSLFNGSL